MAINYRIEERRLVPNWRDFRRTVKLNELRGTGETSRINIDLTNQLNDWSQRKSIGTAADLINGSFLAEIYDLQEIKDACQFILTNPDKSSKLLLDMAFKISNQSIEEFYRSSFKSVELEVNTLEEFQAYVENQTIHKILSLTKNRARNEPLNPIIWVDLSRLYSFFGQQNKAERAMIVALQLAPNNRYVLRSATRMFIHFEKHESALYYLRKSDSIKQDPWLISAHIATSSLINRYSPFIKTGISLADSRQFSDYDITELTSSLGTLEYHEGSIKKAKKFLQQSRKAPNDNSLAQMEWLSYTDKVFAFDAMSFKNVANPFEAFAFDAYQAGDWNEVLRNCVFWFLDIPYSRRPILLGSYTACMLVKDYDISVMLCKAGLNAKPNDLTLLNNLAYSYLMMDKLDEAEVYINLLTARMKFGPIIDDDLITFQATLGLAAFKFGDKEAGRRFYEMAISTAVEKNNKHLEKLATFIYFRELVANNCNEKIELFATRVESLDPGESKELQQIKSDVIAEYRKRQTPGR